MVFFAQIEQQACKLVSASGIAPTRQPCTVGGGRIRLPVGATVWLEVVALGFLYQPCWQWLCVRTRIGRLLLPQRMARSYPAVLLHWTVSIVVSAWSFYGLASTDMLDPWEGARYFAVVLVASIGCSLVFYRLIDRPIEHVRQRIRQRTQKAYS